ncbi:K(+)/H(+) antiporter-like protein 1 [Aaosphaeria arxii CBS 175.79]|uniref:K(+)/H(+) antiporter-like protein 1 n=1 Tax=Aaosphaeria arxii CBS 175.79 TaxID=1450172 RepID=A0A6A5YAG1_9PLEO|nr:K(+)/H(+) antiporter-like protein 1 [Aaosphaeria arxii CBS 175.79]KAF2022216.1 K(+)/H(+) antiporter-like protein 1 [Aaosphaeria arxii CBS 175.79]
MASSTAAAVQTVTQVVTKIASAASATPSSGNKATPQGGVLEHVNPVHYDPKNPIILFIVQASIIIIFCRLLHWPLAKIRQPRVIAEVIGGILLGPSVLGRIPGFKANIFPDASIPLLNLVANLGLTLFLFIIGLEVDLRIATRNWKVALSVGVVGMALPFGLGVAIAVGLYHQFKDEPGTVPINFGIFALFIGVAMAITAFPVLCRILTELKLLDTPVGVIVLAAGVGNDVVGWILLALCVALVNAASGLTALWVLLVCVGYTLFLVYAVRPLWIRLLRWNGAIQDGPSQGIIGLTLLLCLASAFFTGIIGVHAIFGAFLAGMICPHEGGFNIKVAEKIEDLIGALFLPLYFTLSGLNTNIGLLDSGIVWAYVIGVTSVAFFAKFIGAAAAARWTGMMGRECLAIGSLMSCKGLVELIVLNIGLQAKILGTRTFTMFVVMALVTTFMTSPLTIQFYPLSYQKKVAAYRRGEIDWDGNPLDGSESVADGAHYEKLETQKIRRLTVYLRLDSMPNLLAFSSLFGGKLEKQAVKSHPSLNNASNVAERGEPSASEEPTKRSVEAHGLRLLNLTDRGSSVMQVFEGQSYTANDPIVNTFRTFGRLHNLAISGEALVVPESSFADTLTTRAAESDLLLIPWSETGGMSEQAIIEDKGTKNKLAAGSYLSFVSSTLDQSSVTTAVLVNKNFGGPKNKNKPKLARTYSNVSLQSHRDVPVDAPLQDQSHHIFFPFFGGEDDRAALRLVLQLAESPDVTATLVHFEVSDEFLDTTSPTSASSSSDPTPNKGPEATVTPTPASTSPREQDAAFFAALRASLPPELSSRVLFDTHRATNPLQDVLTRAGTEVGQSPRNAGDLIVLGRNIGRKGLASTVSGASRESVDDIRTSTSAGSTLGVLAEKAWQAKLSASVLVVKAARRE